MRSSLRAQPEGAPSLVPRVAVCRLTLLQITEANKIASDNKRAQSVIISGATGPNAPSINGVFDPSLEIHEDRVRYYKRGDAGVCIEHFKQHDDNTLWQIKRASAKGTDSAFIWTGGRRALEACRSSEWFCTEGTDDIEMVGVKLHVQEDAEYKVRCMFKLQLFFVPVIESLMVVRFSFRLLKPRLLLKLPKRPSTPKLSRYCSGWDLNPTCPLSCELAYMHCAVATLRPRARGILCLAPRVAGVDTHPAGRRTSRTKLSSR